MVHIRNLPLEEKVWQLDSLMVFLLHFYLLRLSKLKPNTTPLCTLLQVSNLAFFAQKHILFNFHIRFLSGSLFFYLQNCVGQTRLILSFIQTIKIHFYSTTWIKYIDKILRFTKRQYDKTQISIYEMQIEYIHCCHIWGFKDAKYKEWKNINF